MYTLYRGNSHSCSQHIFFCDWEATVVSVFFNICMKKEKLIFNLEPVFEVIIFCISSRHQTKPVVTDQIDFMQTFDLQWSVYVFNLFLTNFLGFFCHAGCPQVFSVYVIIMHCPPRACRTFTRHFTSSCALELRWGGLCVFVSQMSGDFEVEPYQTVPVQNKFEHLAWVAWVCNSLNIGFAS